MSSPSISDSAKKLVDSVTNFGNSVLAFRENATFKSSGTLDIGAQVTNYFTTMLGDTKVANYDISKPIVVVMVKDPDQSTAGNPVYVDGGAVILYSVTNSGVILTNDHTTSLDYQLSITFNRK